MVRLALAVTMALFVAVIAPLDVRAASTSASQLVSRQSISTWSIGVASMRDAKARMRFIPFDEREFDRSTRQSSRPTGNSGYSTTGRRTGEMGAVTPQAYGSSSTKWAYTVARVANSSNQTSTSITNSPVSAQPYRSTGKLYARWGANWYVCTAALVKKGVLLTAAHCVHDYGQGTSGFANEVLWVPANSTPNGGEFGQYSAREIRIPTPYQNGTDTCTVPGVVCNNDIAAVVLETRNGIHAGDYLGGWYGYGWNGYSFVANSAMGRATVADITQLGYPVAFDYGYQMQRNASFGKFVSQRAKNRKQLLNTQLGSPLTGGSSGGPWFVNFGTSPQITVAASFGLANERNIIVGVTSWGYSTVGVNIQGASWLGQNNEYPAAGYGIYGAGNIGKLMYDTCTTNPSYC